MSEITPDPKLKKYVRQFKKNGYVMPPEVYEYQLEHVRFNIDKIVSLAKQADITLRFAVELELSIWEASNGFTIPSSFVFKNLDKGVKTDIIIKQPSSRRKNAKQKKKR
jgi:hypothetical protein